MFTRNATEGINLVAQSFVRPRVRPGDQVLITGLEHHANIVPWQLLREQVGLEMVVAPINDDGELLLEEFEALLSERTRLVSVTWVSNALGTVNPVHEIIALAHARGLPVLLDAAQAVQHMPVDVQELDCEFLVFSGHKLYGPSGIGVLYGKADLLEAMPPYQGGGEMIASVSYERTEFNEIPYKFEAGTPAIEAAVGLAAAIDYVEPRSRQHRRARGRAAGPRHPSLQQIPGCAWSAPRATSAACCRSSWTARIRRTSARCWISTASRCAPAITARSRRSSGSATARPHGLRSGCTTRGGSRCVGRRTAAHRVDVLMGVG